MKSSAMSTKTFEIAIVLLLAEIQTYPLEDISDWEEDDWL